MVNGMNVAQMKKNAEKASGLHKSMGHPGRLMVLCQLMKGECSVSRLNDVVPLSQSALSQHLAGLRKSGLVETRRESQMIYYSLNSEAASEIVQYLYRIYCNPNVKEKNQ